MRRLFNKRMPVGENGGMRRMQVLDYKFYLLDVPVNDLGGKSLNEVYNENNLESKNLAIPDLTGKEHLGNGVYLLRKSGDEEIFYNIYSGVYITSNANITGGFSRYIPFLLSNDIYTISVKDLNNGRVHFSAYTDENTPNSSFGTSDDVPLIFDNSQGLYNGLYMTTIGINMEFTLQIENGSFATDYSIPYIKGYNELNVNNYTLTNEAISTLGLENIPKETLDFYFNLYQSIKNGDVAEL